MNNKAFENETVRLESLYQQQLKQSGFNGKKNEFRLYNIQGVGDVVGIIGLGEKSKLNNKTAREAASKALRQLRLLNPKNNINVLVNRFGHCLAAAEGAVLASYSFDKYKTEKTGSCIIEIDSETKGWRTGIIMAQAQNMARELMETPSNYLNPTQFASFASSILNSEPNVKLHIRDRKWAESQKMGAFVSVSNGSSQPLRFLEIHYQGTDSSQQPIGLVGKGVTFDSGGISIKPSQGMALMKGDMGGAATVLSSMWAISKLQLPVNIICCIPLTENMPSGSATKPGDVVFARNGKSIEVDNTDAEGRLILADAIHYVSDFKPSAIIELSTLTGAMDVALGDKFAGVFSTSDTLYEQLELAGAKAGDPFWRMPLDDVFSEQIKSSVADLKNVGGKGAGSCTAAIFLKQFIPKDSGIQFAHIDIAGVMHHSSPTATLSAGMSGRPTRAIVNYFRALQ